MVEESDQDEIRVGPNSAGYTVFNDEDHFIPDVVYDFGDAEDDWGVNASDW